MPALAQPTAELWNTIFNVVLVSGAILVLAGTWGAFWTGNMKEFYANTRISANEATTATANATAEIAKADAARANEAASALSKDAAEARLKQEELQSTNLELQKQVAAQGKSISKVEDANAPRSLSVEQQINITNAVLKSLPLRVSICLTGDSEAHAYGRQIIAAFQRGGAIVIDNLIGDYSESVAGADGIKNYRAGILVPASANRAVINILRGAGLPLVEMEVPSREGDFIVGPKPASR